MENLQGALARVFEYRAREFDKMKRGGAAAGDVVSVNLVSLKGGVPSELTASFADAKFVMNMQARERPRALPLHPSAPPHRATRCSGARQTRLLRTNC